MWPGTAKGLLRHYANVLKQKEEGMLLEGTFPCTGRYQSVESHVDDPLNPRFCFAFSSINHGLQVGVGINFL